jgi:hypothetical protein
MARAPARPRYPRHRPKKHENGILTFTTTTEGWQPWPTPEQARDRFDAFVRGWRSNLPGSAVTTARLIIEGEVVEEVALRGEHRLDG